MIKGPDISNTQIPENQSPSSVDGFVYDDKVFAESYNMEDDISGIIMSIGEQLKDPELFDKLSAQYAEMVDGTENNVEEISQMYFDMFANVNLDKNEIKKAVLARSVELLVKVAEGFSSVEDKEQLVTDVIEDLQREKEVQDKAMRDIKLITEKINKKLLDLCILSFAMEEYLYDAYGASQSREEVISEISEKRIVVNGIELSDFLRKDLDRYKDHFLSTMGDYFIVNGVVNFNKALAYARGIKNKSINNEIDDILKVNNELKKAFDNLIYQKELDEDVEADNIPGRVMQKYQEIIDQAKKGKEEIRKIFKDEQELTNKDLNKITNNLIERANALLNEYTEGITEDDKDTDEKIIEKLKGMEANLLLKIDVIKSLKGKIKPEDLEGIDFTVETAGEMVGDDFGTIDKIYDLFASKKEQGIVSSSMRGIMSEYRESIDSNKHKKRIDELWQMLGMYENNWSGYPENLRSTLMKGFVERIKNAKNDTRIYKYLENEKVLTFMRVDDLPNGKKYFGSFNATDVALGSGIASSLVDKVIELEGRDADIEAVCDPQGKVVPWYLDKLGFVINGIDLDYEGTGQAFAKIERKKERIDRYYGDKSKQEVIDQYNEVFSDNMHQEENQIVLKFVIAENGQNDSSEEMNQKIFELTEQNNYQATKCIFNKTDKTSRECYLCFELN